MTANLALHTLQHRRLAIFWFCFGLFLYALVLMALWPAYRNIDLAAFLESMPEAVRAAFLGRGFDNPVVERSGFYQYLGTQFATWLPFLAAYFGVWVGGGVIARAYGRHTIDLLLAQPLTRERFLLTRFGAIAFGVLVIVAGSMVGLLIGAAVWVTDNPLPAGNIVLVHVQLLLFGLAVSAIALVVAALVLEPGRTYGVSALIIIAMYVFSLVSQFVESLEWIGYLSLFRYWRPLEQFATGEFAWMEALVLIGVAVVGTVLAVGVFRRRDIVT
jgi:ABC-2 type transport system permease protein